MRKRRQSSAAQRRVTAIKASEKAVPGDEPVSQRTGSVAVEPSLDFVKPPKRREYLLPSVAPLKSYKF